MKSLTNIKFAIFTILFLLMLPVRVFGFNTFFNYQTTEYISRGVAFEESFRVTDTGLLHVFTLRLPANDPNILLAPASSQNAPGLKEPASRLLGDTGAIAGVNGDFFGLAGTHSMPAGLQINTNGVLSVPHNHNFYYQRFSSFMLAADGNYFMDYVNATVRFFNNGAENIELGSMNKVADLAAPSVLTSDFMPDTSSIDERISDSVKIVVRNDTIVHISQRGETVSVPQDGYVIIMSGALANSVLYRFAPGQTAHLYMSANIDIWNLESAISGGARILLHGNVMPGGGVAGGVHPRTAIGLTACRTEIILMVVDGRSHSVGVSHSQLAHLMLEAGAYNAMHLDGGGSTQMMVQRPGESSLSIVNHPSGGFERRIINALGVYTLAPVGPLHSLVIDLPDTVIMNVAEQITVVGLDEYMRPIDIPQSLVHVSSSPGGFVSQSNFIAYTPGWIAVTAYHAGMFVQKQIYATELFEIIPNVDEIRTSVGGSTVFGFTGVGRNGNLFDINPHSVQIEVFPPGLGSVLDGMFMARTLGAGWLRFSVGQTSAYVPVYATIVSQAINSLAGDRPISFSPYPDHVHGAAFYTPIPGFFQPVAALAYYFNHSDYTQSAYANFEGLTSQEAKGFRMAVFGDLSGLALHGQLTDANGRRHRLEFARVIDWEGWRDVEVWLPDNIAHPVTLSSVNVAAWGTDREISGTIYLSNLRGLYDFTWQFPEVTAPPSDRFRDHLHVVFYQFADYGHDVTFMPDTAAPAAHAHHASRAMDVFLFNAAAGIYMGSFPDDFQAHRAYTLSQNQTVLTEYTPEFNIFGIGGLFVIQMSATGENGQRGLIAADRAQWGRLQEAVNMSYTPNVMLLLDQSPFSFTNDHEQDLLHRLLRSFVQQGYNIFVLSPGGRAPDVRVIDGVRYMTLGALYDGALNEEFSVLRFRLSGNDVKYSIENIFN